MVSEHYADDLEVDLEDAMLQDFNAELQDDSPRQVCHCMAASFSPHFMHVPDCSQIKAAITMLLTAAIHYTCQLSPRMLARQL